MNPVCAEILGVLAADCFPRRVAIWRAVDPDLGPIWEVNAVDVPGDELIDVIAHLNRLLPWRPGRETLGGAIENTDVARRLAPVPADAIWYEPQDLTSRLGTRTE